MSTPTTKRNAIAPATTVHQEPPIWAQVEQLSLKLSALEVLLFNATGEACESFNTMDEAQREVYLAHCADLATATKAEAQRITRAALEAARAPGATA